jgi:DNA-binding FadR family transcriptional regulator
MDNLPALNQAAPIDRGRERGDADALRVELERELRSGRWKVGEKLPTERDLCDSYGVARNTIRRALQALEDAHLIVRHVGRGTFRADNGNSVETDAFHADGIEAIGPADVMECRLLFEPELASLVVARASQADIDRMTDCVKGMDAANTVADFERWDNTLHDAIAVATHNLAAVSVARSLARVREQAEWGALKERGMTPERKVALQSQHYAIVAAFRQRDRIKARALLREHVLFVQNYMFGE